MGGAPCIKRIVSLNFIFVYCSTVNIVFVEVSTSANKCLRQTAICHVQGTPPRSAVDIGATAFIYWNNILE